MPTITEPTFYLEINSVPLATPAWKILDLSSLLDAPDIRGEDRLLPGTTGVRARRRRITVTRRPLPIIITGRYDQDGSANANRITGLATNIDYLRTNVVDPLGTGDGTRTAILHLPASTRTAAVHVIAPMHLTPIGAFEVRGVLELSIPAGVWT